MIPVLILTPFYPTLENEAFGCFIAEPLRLLEGRGFLPVVLAVHPAYRRAPRTPHPAYPPARRAGYLPLPGNWGLPASGPLLAAQARGLVRRLHRETGFKLIHAHGVFPCGRAAASWARELGVPFVVSVHGLDAFHDRQAPGWSKRWCRESSILTYMAASKVLCVSRLAADIVTEGTGRHGGVEVLYNGVDTELFHPGEKEPEEAVVLSVGNLTSIKGQDVVLRALASIREKFKGLRYEIIGEGPERERLERLAVELDLGGRVSFLGAKPRAEVAQAMRRCSVFALPSRYEALGCVYLEAMASGKPVIACRGQGIAEVISHGENGWLVGTDDVWGVSAALEAILVDADRRRTMGQAARETILLGFGHAALAEKMSQIYRGALS